MFALFLNSASEPVSQGTVVTWFIYTLGRYIVILRISHVYSHEHVFIRIAVYTYVKFLTAKTFYWVIVLLWTQLKRHYFKNEKFQKQVSYFCFHFDIFLGYKCSSSKLDTSKSL